MSEFDPQELSLSAWRRALRRAFPERHVMVRADTGGFRSWTLGSVFQATVAGVAVILLGVFTYGVATAVWVDALIDAKNAEVSHAEDNYKQLLAEVALYRDQVAVVTRGLEDNHAVLARYMDHVDPEAAEAGTPAGPSTTEDTLAEAGRARDALLAQLATMEEGMAELSEAHQLLSQFDNFELEMRKMVLQRDLALDENKALTDRVGDLEGLVIEMETAQAALLEHFGSVAQTRIADLETTLSDAGLDVEHLLEQALANTDGQGGPFVPAGLPMLDRAAFKDTVVSLNHHVDRLGALKGLTDQLPLTRPVVSGYRVSSPFGVRQDPINGRMARHEGIDYAAASGTPVLAPAAGKVVYVGWRRGYGRTIEISHGLGLTTRYGHLSAATVSAGDLVTRGQQVGRIGNTGRSTGSHLHYEIRVNGHPRNPARFIEAGKHVFQG
ncbi:peptidoglycan DD-metalloendopeptidase family protein [Roseospira visakhapatnamensis]|uniref:Murein DD-endopeptidase MepM/ murein hydrolase activator NlpD n=1 Tax=Roseospira visakhapatnamensis TaxID=390880 RepID=A0A7W6RG52_9PROT|nr:peptidoglycan DD-metalloendopeptidase family protein [Roseospira visakhapatnamensis]MBB4267404.1 murein DD-endopeptidase MepM/ murein hydrolase activator NlpD [Roseospira visakhapatnamensis]